MQKCMDWSNTCLKRYGLHSMATCEGKPEVSSPAICCHDITEPLAIPGVGSLLANGFGHCPWLRDPEIPNCCARRAGLMTPIKPGPFQIGFHEDRAQRRCRAPAALQGLSGIVIPSRKIQARHIGPLCSIRGKSGRGRTGDEPYRRVGQISGQLKSRRALRVAEALRFFFFSSTLAHNNGSQR